MRVLFVTALLGLLAGSAFAAPSQRWFQSRRAQPDEDLTLTIAIKHSDGDKLFDELMTVSDPRSAQYGNHWTHDQVNEFIRPSAESHKQVQEWLVSNGVDVTAAEWSVGGEWVSVPVKVSQAERLLNTKYHEYKHTETGKLLLRSDEYSLPDEVAKHIDIVGPTTRFPVVKDKNADLVQSTVSQHRHARKTDAPADICSSTTPDCIRSYYGMNGTAATSGKASVGVTAYLEQYISLKDLDTFFNKYDPKSVGRVPTIIGPNDESKPGVEASLDIQFVAALAHGSDLTFWYTSGRSPKNPDNEPFLSWAQSLANSTTLPWVISTSYGDDEDTVDVDYAKRMSQEFSKLGLRGISILFSSGDSGTGCSKDKKHFMPTLPASLPSVTAIGATGIIDSKSERASTFSSGGVSTLFPVPSYQADAVAYYFKTYASQLPPATFYNNSGQWRSFPDISMVGEDFPIVVSGSVMPVDGTSCSAPTAAAFFSTLVDIRLKAGKSPLGFLNPLIYQHPEVFNDITAGSNPNCGTKGFPALKGWDASTGLGSINWAAWVKLVESL